MHVTLLCVELVCCSVCGHVGLLAVHNKVKCGAFLKWLCLSIVSQRSNVLHTVVRVRGKLIDVELLRNSQWEYVNASMVALSLYIQGFILLFKVYYISWLNWWIARIVNLSFTQRCTACQACLDAQQSGEKYRGRKCSSYFYTVINISFTKADTIFIKVPAFSMKWFWDDWVMIFSSYLSKCIWSVKSSFFEDIAYLLHLEAILGFNNGMQRSRSIFYNVSHTP